MTALLPIGRQQPPEIKYVRVDGRYTRMSDTIADLLHMRIVSRRSIFGRGTRCHYCGARAKNRDHIVARSRGGRDAWWNLVPSCIACNEAKGVSFSTCSCAFCERAKWLWAIGFTRTQHGWALAHEERAA